MKNVESFRSSIATAATKVAKRTMEADREGMARWIQGASRQRMTSTVLSSLGLVLDIVGALLLWHFVVDAQQAAAQPLAEAYKRTKAPNRSRV